MKRYLMMGGAWIAFALGAVGVVVPVLPTTPFILLAAFLFAKSSPRIHRWLCSTKIYQHYVVAFQKDGGLPVAHKAKALGLTYAVLALSAFLVHKPVVWAILGIVAVCLTIFIGWRIPTLKTKTEPFAAEAEAE